MSFWYVFYLILAYIGGVVCSFIFFIYTVGCAYRSGALKIVENQPDVEGDPRAAGSRSVQKTTVEGDPDELDQYR